MTWIIIVWSKIQFKYNYPFKILKQLYYSLILSYISTYNIGLLKTRTIIELDHTKYTTMLWFKTSFCIPTTLFTHYNDQNLHNYNIILSKCYDADD